MSVMRNGPSGTHATTVLVPVMLLLIVSSTRALRQTDSSSEKQQKQHQNEPSKPKDEPRHYSITVTVQAGSDNDSKPIEQAEVTVFAGDYKSEIKTDGDGKASFAFDTTFRTATVRVVADHFQTEQLTISLDALKKECKVSLKKSD
jgi:hypothetical protein